MRSKSLRAYKKPDLKELIGNWNHGTEIHICGLLGVVAVLLVWVNLSTLSGEPRTGGEPNMEPQEIPVELGLTADFHRGMSPAVRHNLYSENSMENRIKGRFVPGVSGNPGGRPKGTLRCEIKRLMEQDSPEVLREGEQSRTYLEVFVLTLVKLALRGHPQAIKEVCGRYDGAIPQVVDLTDHRDRPVIQVSWVSPDDGKPEENERAVSTIL